MNDKSIKLKLNLVYLIFYGATGCLNPFLIIYLKFRGFDFVQIGIVLASMSIVGVISQPVFGYITDKYLNPRISLIISMIFSCISVFLLSLVSSFWPVFLTIISVSVFQNSVFPILDSFCFQLSNEYENIQYGRVRLRGSVGYAVCVLASGIIINYTSITVPYYIYCLLILFGIIAMNTIKHKVKAPGQAVNLKDVSSLFKERRFVIFILSVMILNATMGANGNYISELVKKTGGDTSNLGLLWFIIALSETPILFFSSKILSRFKDLKLYYVCIFFFAIRYFADAICTSYQAVIVIQVLQCVTFGLYIISGLHYINRIIEPRLNTSGMTIYAAVGGGLGGFIGNLGGGVILQSFDIFWLYKALAVVCLISLFVGIFVERRSKYDRGITLNG